MRKTVDFRLLTLATLLGFLGGALSSIALPQLVFAQDEPAEKIVAHEFHVVDDQGKVVGWFGAGARSVSRVALRDENSDFQPQRTEGKIELRNSDGIVAWYAPPPPRTLFHPLASGSDR